MENIKAFAKLYGYVQWFHPRDEAHAPNNEALKDSLLKLFLPIAPTLETLGGQKSMILLFLKLYLLIHWDTFQFSVNIMVLDLKLHPVQT